MEKNNKAAHVGLLFTYLHQNLFNIKENFALVIKKNCPCSFREFETNFDKTVNIFCTLPE